jgi:hypothetical protein
MTDLTPGPPQELPQGPPSRQSSMLPAAITVGCSFLFLIGSLFGALTTCGFQLNGTRSGNNVLFNLFGGLAILSFVMLLAAIVWFAIALIIWIIRNSGSEL